MALLLKVDVTEDIQSLKRLCKQAPAAFKPRIKMLQLMKQGICATKELTYRTKASADSIAEWKKRYRQGGIKALTEEKRGAYQRGALSGEQHIALKNKLSSPKEGFTSYKEAMVWINESFGLTLQYQGVNKYLKRNFRTRLKVGRRSHVHKDPAAEAVFKKAW